MRTLHILFYDGECAFCHWSVKFVARCLKTQSDVHFAPLQGVTAHKLRSEGLPIPTDLDAVSFVEGGRVYLGPFAFFAVAKHFRWPYSVITCGRFVPACLSWGIYRVTASNRYRLFGKTTEACLLPTAEQRAAQLD